MMKRLITLAILVMFSGLVVSCAHRSTMKDDAMHKDSMMEEKGMMSDKKMMDDKNKMKK